MRTCLGVGLSLLFVVAACSDSRNSTGLNPEGPPEILQMFVQEKVMDGASTRNLPQLAFGSHPDINLEDYLDDGEVIAAVAVGTQRFRIVFDELLVGNNIEEIGCDDGTFSRVPEGTTPDDVADCAPPELSRCTKVCIGADGPIGIIDEDEDGAADDLRMIADIITISCGGLPMPWDRQQSFWQPSGNQLISAGQGITSLGPAIIIVPTDDGIRTGSECTLQIDPAVVDKEGLRPCARAGQSDGSCTPGDFDAISFTVEPLSIAGNDPPNGSTNIAPISGGGNATVLVQFNAPIDDTTLGAITVADETATFADCGGTPVPPCVTRERGMNDRTLITITVVGGFTPLNLHTVTASTGLTDIHGGPLAQEATITFTTRDNAPAPDADVTPDAGTTPDA